MGKFNPKFLKNENGTKLPADYIILQHLVTLTMVQFPKGGVCRWITKVRMNLSRIFTKNNKKIRRTRNVKADHIKANSCQINSIVNEADLKVKRSDPNIPLGPDLLRSALSLIHIRQKPAKQIIDIHFFIRIFFYDRRLFR